MFERLRPKRPVIISQYIRILSGLIAGLCLLALSTALQAQTSAHSDWPGTEQRLSRLLAGSSEQKRTALAEIRNIRTPQAARLALAALSDRDEVVRGTAASSVIFLPKEDAEPALLSLLDDKKPFVRREAAYALGHVGASAAAIRLRRLMTKDRDLEVRAAAAAAIGSIGDRSALDDLLGILRRRPKEEEEFLRRTAARAVGQIFENVATGSTEILTPQNFLPPEFKTVDSASDSALALDPAYVGRIAATLSSIIREPNEADDTRREAAFALGALRRPESAVLLRSLLNSPDPYLAEISKEALLKIREIN